MSLRCRRTLVVLGRLPDKIAGAKPGQAGQPMRDPEGPEFIALTCHRVLVKAGDPRAHHWIAQAHELVQKQAAGISDAGARHSFLHNLPSHRAVVEAWAAWQEAGQSA